MEQALMAGVRWVTLGLEMIGIAVIVVGAVVAIVTFLRQLRSPPRSDKAISDFRSNLGRSILLGLEFLVAADIVNTVAIEPTLDSLAVLAGIVLIRTFLSFALEVEIEGRWPWQGRAGTARDPAA